MTAHRLTNVIVLDLDAHTRLMFSANGAMRNQRWRSGRRGGRSGSGFVHETAGEMFETIIAYGGSPASPRLRRDHVEKHRQCRLGVGTLQNDGADLLFPCKDHPSDKPATANASPCRTADRRRPWQIQARKRTRTSTFHWLTNPIANYSLVFNAAPYRIIEEKFKSVNGDMIPLVFLRSAVQRISFSLIENEKTTHVLRKISRAVHISFSKLGIGNAHLMDTRPTCVRNRFVSLDSFDG
jgi:hypothetical protein